MVHSVLQHVIKMKNQLHRQIMLTTYVQRANQGILHHMDLNVMQQQHHQILIPFKSQMYCILLYQFVLL